MSLTIEARTKQELLFRNTRFQDHWIQFYRWSDGNVRVSLSQGMWPGVTLTTRNQKSLMCWLEWSSK